MQCGYCGFNNGAEDHRCLRCGRRIGIAVAAPAAYVGATALAVAPALEPEAHPSVIPDALIPDERTAKAPGQSELFPASGPKVIPFPAPAVKQSPEVKQTARPAQRLQPARAASQQTALDFLSAPPAQRTLRDEVPAQIDCEQAVAAPMHRFVASSIDAAFILIGFGLFVAISQLMGSGFGTGKLFWVFVGACFTLIAVFYGLIFAIAGRETAGMRSTDLQLITFDGLHVEGRTRAVRLAATWLSFCSGGLGLVWALADEENLTWQDHISKTFPAVKQGSAGAVRR